jgi:hypothetical protein
MKNIPGWRILVIIGVLLASISRARAADPAKEDAAFSAKLLGAIQNSDYDAFVAGGTEAFHGITKAQFSSVSSALSQKLKTAQVTFLGELAQHGYRVTLWKLSFADGSDDALATLSVKDGKIGGYWIK